jgi:hypothetical protein
MDIQLSPNLRMRNYNAMFSHWEPNSNEMPDAFSPEMILAMR